jgi:uncharacterized protein YjbJ (UPF0337 family)
MHLRSPFFASAGLLVLTPAFAQTPAATSAPAAASSGGMGWLWIILLLILVAAAVWFFMFRNKGSTHARTGVDHDRVAGSAKQAKGSIKDTVGGVLGDTKLQAEGKLDKVEGKAQNTLGGVKDSLRGDDPTRR